MNTIAASAAATYLAAHASAAYLAQHADGIMATHVWRLAQVHSYDLAFYVGAGFVLLAGLGGAFIFPAGRRPVIVPESSPEQVAAPAA